MFGIDTSTGVTNTWDYRSSGRVEGTDVHSHTVDLPANAGYTATTGTGSHGVMQPSLVLNYIIRALP